MVVPSVRTKVNVMSEPQVTVLATVKVKVLVTAAPPGATTPKFCELEATTPPVACSVAVKLTVGVSPVLVMGKVTVRVSPGSGAPFAGAQLSEVMFTAPAFGTATPLTQVNF